MPRTHSRVSRTIGVPWEIDLLKSDLDEELRGFARGRPVSWGLAVRALDKTWMDTARIQGRDWEIDLFAPGDLQIPVATRGTPPRIRMTPVKHHAVLFIVHGSSVSVNRARDVGRTGVRSLMALFRREMPLFVPSEVLWEGALARRISGKLAMSAATPRLEPRRPITTERIHDLGLAMAPLGVSDLPPHLASALQWMSLARSARIRAEQFIHLWLAVLALASQGKRSRKDDMERIKTYTATMGSGIAGVRSVLSIAALNQRLRTANHARHALIHRNDDALVTVALLDDLESCLFELVDFELAKLGIALAKPRFMSEG